MSRLLSGSFIFLIWFVFSLFVIIVSFLLFQKDSFRKKIESANFSKPSIYSSYLTSPPDFSQFSVDITKFDARPLLIDKFLAENNSPMKGLGTFFVDTADRFNLDWRLLPSIAYKESSLGKVMPKKSHNAFGWAIYAGEDSGATFSSWEKAIEEVARGLKTDYIDKGLKTPAEIMRKYTPQSNGSWANDIKAAMEDISN